MGIQKNQPVPIAGVTSASAGDSAQVEGIIFPTLARDKDTDSGLGAGVYASAEMFNPGARGVRLFTVVGNGSGTVTVKVQVRDPNTDAWVDLAGATTAALNNTAGTITTIYPGLTGIADSAGVTINQHIGPCWRAVATVATATETFSVGADYLI